jgi:DtxR family Mn-dependent transcriptional regulator
MRYSVSEENYIKNIFNLQQANDTVSTTMLAAAVNTKAASVTDMLKKLYVKKIINYKPYKNFTLTDTGNKIALDIIRKHRLWEYFLVNKLGMKWDEYLGHPCFDPHGDPIPDKNGKIRVVKQSDIATLPLKKILTVSSIKDQSVKMLDLLKHYHIRIGTKLKINRKFEFDGSVEIKVEKYPATILSEQVAKNIFCTV